MADWYHQVVGFAVLRRDDETAVLGVHESGGVLVSLQQIRGKKTTTAFTGLASFTVLLPNRVALMSALAWVKVRRVPLLAQYTAGRTIGFAIHDPEGNVVRFAFDLLTENVGQRDKWRQLGETHLQLNNLPTVPGQLLKTIPSGTKLSQAEFRVQSLPTTIKYLVNVLGFSLYGGNSTQAWLGTGDVVQHITLLLTADAQLQLPPPRPFGLRYLSFVVPSLLTLQQLRDQLAAVGNDTYDYSEKRQYLMAAGPNRLTLWFTVG